MQHIIVAAGVDLKDYSSSGVIQPAEVSGPIQVSRPVAYHAALGYATVRQAREAVKH